MSRGTLGGPRDLPEQRRPHLLSQMSAGLLRRAVEERSICRTKNQTATRWKTRAKLEHSPSQRTSHENSYSRLVQFKNIPDLKIHVTLQVKMQDTARDRSATGLHLPAPGWATEETRLPGCYSLNEGCAAGSITAHDAARSSAPAHERDLRRSVPRLSRSPARATDQPRARVPPQRRGR